MFDVRRIKVHLDHEGDYEDDEGGSGDPGGVSGGLEELLGDVGGVGGDLFPLVDGRRIGDCARNAAHYCSNVNVD